jgi:threonyl-tRNA synthetase
MAAETERKTLEQRQQMTELERIRHSAAHVLATAILKLFPEAQFAAGPPVDNGFYYDLELPYRISPDDFGRIEEEMKREIKANHTFQRIDVTRTEALEMASKGRLGALADRPSTRASSSSISSRTFPEHEQISLYQNGDFIDLCAGPHVMRTGNVGAFKLTHVASAYYKGDERNPQLSESTAPLSRTRRSWRPTSPCWRRRRSGITASSAASSSSSVLTTTSDQASRSGCLAAPC